MKRPRWHPPRCKGCGGRAADGVYISATGLCPACGMERVEQNYDALTTKSGPELLHWRRRIAASVGAVLLDDLQPKP